MLCRKFHLRVFIFYCEISLKLLKLYIPWYLLRVMNIEYSGRCEKKYKYIINQKNADLLAEVYNQTGHAAILLFSHLNFEFIWFVKSGYYICFFRELCWIMSLRQSAGPLLALSSVPPVWS